MKKTTALLTAALLTFAIACTNAQTETTSKTAVGEAPAQTTPVAKNVSVAEFAELIKNENGIILDVRTEGEVAAGAIDGSINIDYYSDDFQAEIDKLDKTKPIYVYCAVGGRSGNAMKMMAKKGFLEVYNLSGGYNAWVKQ